MRIFYNNYRLDIKTLIWNVEKILKGNNYSSIYTNAGETVK